MMEYIHPSKVGGFNAKKKFQLIVLDYHTGLFDPINKKRVDEQLPPNVKNAGIYNPNREWLRYYKKYARKSSVETIENELKQKGL